MEELKLAVIGDPIEHSLSPLVHGEVLGYLGVKHSYEKINVKSNELNEFIEYAKSVYDGINITMPHKTAVISALDDIDTAAERCGSVNTAVFRNGKAFGTSTDGIGFRLALERRGFSFSGKSVLILGAGGAARCIAAEAAADGADIVIANRTVKTGSALANVLNGIFNAGVKSTAFYGDEFLSAVSDCDILINTTPLGMEGCPGFDSLDFVQKLKPSATVFDLIYSPYRTELLCASEESGHDAFCGFDMLIFQAIEAEKHFLNTNLDTRKVFEAVFKRLYALCGLEDCR